MPANGSTTPVELAAVIVGQWHQTYQWIPIFSGIAACFMAFSAGANNIPISFSSLIGSGRLIFLKVAVVAFFIYVPGATFGNSCSVNGLLSSCIRENQPSEGFLMWSMVVVLITATIWLAIATYFELSVSPQQSIQAAIFGTVLVTKGFRYVLLRNKNESHNFAGEGLVWILLEWSVAPIMSFVCGFCLFVALRNFILRSENGEKRIFILLPIYYGLAAGLVCFFIMYQVIPVNMRVYRRTIIISIVIATLLGALLSLSQALDGDDDRKNPFEDAIREFMEMRVLNTVYEEDEENFASPQISPEIVQIQSAVFKQLLESSANHLVQTRNLKRTKKMQNVSQFIRDLRKSIFFPVINCERETLIRHALTEKFDEVEDLLCFPHILTSCIFAFVQSVSETCALMSPFQVVLEIFNFRSKFFGNGEHVGPSFIADWWLRVAGGIGASMGFLLCGWRLTHCLATRLTYISHSRGLAFQLPAVATMILMNRLNFPVSSVQTSIGALLGVAIADKPHSVNWKLLLKILFGWVMTIVICCLIAYGLYFSSTHSPAFVVP